MRAQLLTLALCLPLALALALTTACGQPAAKCTTATCTGCCDQATDQCLAGSEAAACGAGGTFCIACPGTQVCSSMRACGPAPMNVSCTASNCEGCCDSTGACFKGTSTESCGAGGAACAVCGSAQACQRVNASVDMGGRCTP